MAGYLLGAFGGGWLIATLAAPSGDREVEAAMTGAFYIGPFVALLAFLWGFWRRPRGSRYKE